MKTTLRNLGERALSAIEKREHFIYDIAAESGQIVDNVAHMTWFKIEVARWLINNVSAYEHLKLKDDK